MELYPNFKLVEVTPLDILRNRAEEFINKIFRETYNADLYAYLPILHIIVKEDSNDIVAAFGTRDAESHDLFLEKYLDNSIDFELSKAFGVPISRQGVFEVGNLAVTDLRYYRMLMKGIISYLENKEGLKYAVFTATPTLKNSLVKHGYVATDLGPASIFRLSPDERAHWGSYYETSPRVFALVNESLIPEVACA